MRDDLNKVLVERERNGGGRKFPRQVKHKGDLEDLDNVAIHTGIKKAYGRNTEATDRNTKVSTDVLAPLYGLVRKNTGKNWDKFYSQLCKNFNKDSVVNAHILQHLFDYIQIKTKLINEVVHYNTGRTYNGISPWEPIDHHVQYYVHPTTKCIVKNKNYKSYKQLSRERAKEEKKEVTSCVINASLEFHKFNDIWYAFEFDMTPAGHFYQAIGGVDEHGSTYFVTKYEAAYVYDLLAQAKNGQSMLDAGCVSPYFPYNERSWNKILWSISPIQSRYTSLTNKTQEQVRYAKTKRQLSHQELKRYKLI